ncbi:hypothetical protein B6U79_01415 [Candidatus Bathyarchaeota archaeon ex4484_231]|nr:MAG: hypothetical protein B6U79_01415 [Candidatus Bathyarchaeota archaeon ex4484_231]
MGRTRTVFSIAYSILKISGALLAAWLTLGRNVKKARSSFEAELVKEGMSKEDAEKISECYSELKDQLMDLLKGAVQTGRKWET